MATAISDPPISPALTRRLHTATEYAQMTSLGFFDGERLELIFGELIQKEMPQRPAHATAVDLAAETLRTLFTQSFRVRIQLPLALAGSQSVPEPDVAVVEGSPRDFATEHPAHAALVVEVSDTTLEADRTTKALAYARGGIEDYWIVNVNERTVEVRRQPTESGYQSLQTFRETESVAPLVAPQSLITVAELLP